MEKMFLILLFTRLSIISPYTLENIWEREDPEFLELFKHIKCFI